MTDDSQIIDSSNQSQSVSPEESESMEKMIQMPQSKLNKLVQAKYNDGYQKGMGTQSAGLSTGMMGPSQAELDKMIQSRIADELKKHHETTQAEAQRLYQENEGKRILNELSVKIGDAQKRYPDYDETLNQVNWKEIPEVLHYANLADNAGDVLYDLAKNPGKIGTLRGLTPQLAAREIAGLSGTIKQNQQAQSINLPREPQSQLKPSNVGVGDGGRPSLRDLKQKYRV